MVRRRPARSFLRHTGSLTVSWIARDGCEGRCAARRIEMMGRTTRAAVRLPDAPRAWKLTPPVKKLYSPGLTAGRGQPLQRLHLHLAVDEQARRRDALADILRQPGSSSSIDQIDSGRALPEEAGSPASGFWCIVAGRVFQPEGFVIALETAGERHGRSGACIALERRVDRRRVRLAGRFEAGLSRRGPRGARQGCGLRSPA